MIDPCINVVTVAYNAEDGIEGTIRSVVSQTYSHINFVVVDGGSSDSTIEICNRYRKQIHCFISEPDNGIYDAMNKGLNNSKDGWVIFLNAGDTFHSSSVLSDVFSGTEYETDDILLFGKWFKEGRIFEPKPKSLLKSGILYACHQAFFFRVTPIRYDDTMKIHADLEFVCQYGDRGTSRYVDVCVSNYEGGGASTWLKNQKQRRKDRYRTVWRHFGVSGLVSTLTNRLVQSFSFSKSRFVR